jgi:HAD superfamily hydrolase (TIGR01459 family)
MADRTRTITGFRDLADQYAVALCDIWGVIHNGHALFDGVADALMRYRARGGAVILVSNAPRPAESVVPQLDGLGLPREAWDAIVTSGDVTRSQIIAAATRPMWHLGPTRDRPLFEGLKLNEVHNSADADIVVCTGLFDDRTETAEDYRPLLEGFRARDVAMICANPDIVVERGGKLIYCAGAIADLYATLGGAVMTCGKPHRPIYDAAFAIADSLLKRAVSPREVLAIGDSVRTDLSGAAAIGCGALFVAAGIHGAEVKGSDGRLDADRLAPFFAANGVTPDAAITALVW